MNPQHLLDIARLLAGGTGISSLGRPRQADLCRAVSTAYYAMFHALALCGANMIVGSTNRNQPAWHQAYRALEHGYAKNQCNNRRVMDRFPPEIRQFGVWFVYMQRERETADYDPGSNFSRSYVFELISYTAAIIAQFEDVERDERRAFAVFVLFRLR